MISLDDALRLVDHIGTFECKIFRKRIFKRHQRLCLEMARIYAAEARRNGYVEANNRLRKIDSDLRLAKTGLYADVDDNELFDYSEAKSKAVEKEIFDFARRFGTEAAVEHAKKVCEDAGIEFPLEIRKGDSEEQIKKKTVAALARICSAQWWRRRLRMIGAQAVEHLLRTEALVSKHRWAYVSDYTLHRRILQKARNAKCIDEMEAVNQDGFVINLADASGASVANPVNRRNELMTRIAGFEEVARSLDFVGVFYTLTAPSKYHATGHDGRKNDKYNGTTPAEAQSYLCNVWGRTRAEWSRKGVRTFGFRFVEPHHDGTPHWHLLLFMEKENSKKVTEIFRRHALREDGGEPGAEKNRFEAVDIDWSRGSAAGYVAKYVSKNIDGFGIESDADYETARGTVGDNARRVEAWASTWGIRQFQQIGSVSVTVWRELRRRGIDLLTIGSGELDDLRNAANTGNWAEFVRLMGGPLIARDEAPLRALHVLSDTENKYGEVFARVRGIVMGGTRKIITRLDVWTLRKKRASRCVRGFGQWKQAG